MYCNKKKIKTDEKTMRIPPPTMLDLADASNRFHFQIKWQQRMKKINLKIHNSFSSGKKQSMFWILGAGTTGPVPNL